MLNSVSDVCSCSSFFSCLSAPATKTGLITTLALIAIGCVIVGSFGVVAALNPHSWVVLSGLGMNASASLLTAGTIALFVAAFLPCLFCNPDASQEELSSKVLPKNILSAEILRPIVQASAKNAHYISSSDALWDDTFEKMISIYKDIDNIPVIYDYFETTLREYELILLTDEEFLDLPLSQIADFKYFEMSIVIQRLSLIEKRGEDIYNEGATGTLHYLRACSDKERLLNMTTKDANIVCLFSAKQLSLLLADPEHINDKHFIDRLLPIGRLTMALSYTKERLQSLSTIPEILPYLSFLPLSHLRLLPNSYFESSNWQWSEDNITDLISIKPLLEKESKIIAEVLTPNIIRRCAKNWQIEHLSLFSKELLFKPDFPWEVFMSLQGFGSWLRNPGIFFTFHKAINWKVFAELAPAECAIVFTESNLDSAKGALETKIREISIDTVAVLAPIWQPRHIIYFSSPILLDPKFPWAHLAEKTYIGSFLKNIFLKRKNTLKQLPFPWDQLNKVEAEILLRIDPNKKSLHPLKYLNVDAIQQLAPHLTVAHLDVMGENLDHPKFPWHAFANQEGFDTWLQQHDLQLGSS